MVAAEIHIVESGVLLEFCKLWREYVYLDYLLLKTLVLLNEEGFADRPCFGH